MSAVLFPLQTLARFIPLTRSPPPTPLPPLTRSSTSSCTAKRTADCFAKTFTHTERRFGVCRRARGDHRTSRRRTRSVRQPYTTRCRETLLHVVCEEYSTFYTFHQYIHTHAVSSAHDPSLSNYRFTTATLHLRRRQVLRVAVADSLDGRGRQHAVGGAGRARETRRARGHDQRVRRGNARTNIHRPSCACQPGTRARPSIPCLRHCSSHRAFPTPLTSLPVGSTFTTAACTGAALAVATSCCRWTRALCASGRWTRRRVPPRWARQICLFKCSPVDHDAPEYLAAVHIAMRHLFYSTLLPFFFARPCFCFSAT